MVKKPSLFSMAIYVKRSIPSFHAFLKVYLQSGAKLDAKLADALKKASAEVYDVVKDKVVRRNLVAGPQSILLGQDNANASWALLERRAVLKHLIVTEASGPSKEVRNE